MTPVKFVVTSDVHAHTWKSFGDHTDRKNTRLQYTLKMLRAVLDKARELDAAWLDAGDIIHTTGSAKHSVSSELISLLEEYPDVYKYLIFGNHDSRGKGGKVEIEDSFQFVLQKSINNLHVIEREVVEYNGITIYGCGAQHDRSLLEYREADIGLYHDFVKGAKLPSGITLSDGIDQNVLFQHHRLSIVGDIHAPHLQKRDGRYILIPGSPEAHSFADEGDRGWYIVTVTDDNVDISPVVSDSPKFITVSSSKEVEDDNNFYRVIGEVDTRDIPENAKVIAPAQESIATRNVLKITDGIDGILAKWMELNPPEDSTGDYISAAKELLSDIDLTTPQNNKLLRVYGENFCSYEQFDYTLEEGVTVILGQNGAGKSTLIGESVYWTLFGKTTKGQTSDGVVRRGQKKCKVSLDILLDSGKTLTVTRERTPSLKFGAVIDGEEFSAATNRELESEVLGVLGLNEKLVKALLYFSQEDLTLISRATDAEIKDVISDIAGLTGFQDAATKASKKVSTLDSKYNEDKTSLRLQKEWLQQGRNNLLRYEESSVDWEDWYKKELAGAEEDVALTKNQLSLLKKRNLGRIEKKKETLSIRAHKWAEEKAKRKYTEVYNRTIEESNEEVDKLKKQLNDIETGKHTLEQLVTSRNKGTEVRKRLKEEQSDLRVELVEVTKIHTELIAEIERATKIGTGLQKGFCSQCGQAHTDPKKLLECMQYVTEGKKRETEVSKSIEDRKAKIAELVEEEKTVETKLEKINIAIEAHREKKVLSEKIADFTASIEEKSKYSAEYSSKAVRDSYLNKRFSVLDTRVNRAVAFLLNNKSKLEQALVYQEKAVEKLRNETNPHTQNVEGQKVVNEDAEKRTTELEKELEETKKELAVYSYWNKSFGKSGIQSLLMDEIAAGFNNARTKIFPVLTNGVYDVQFSTQTTIGSGELREKLSFLVYQNGGLVPYADLSGGQRRRVDLGVLLTLTASVCESYGISGLLGVLVLDEVASFLDDEGAEALADALKEYVQWAVPSIYIIDHKSELQSLFSQELMIELNDGVSMISD